MLRIITLIGLLGMQTIMLAQAPSKPNSSEILHALKKLNVLGSVLYVAAHPDDENTRMISYFANEELMQTAYLSATRGDGGQNLLASDIREKLGIIRTQELLAARRTDGGQQFFSRANDFGYSKHPDETFNIWDKKEVLADFVWVIRNFKPDIMITRFHERPGVTHGHHTASAILAREAFKLAGDPNAFPEQLEYVEPWSPSKLYWNTSWWFYRITGEKFDTTGLKKVDVGAYNSLIGKSYTELAAYSRSMHKSQGFGSTGSRGSEIEYLDLLEGNDTPNPFDDINTTWNRIDGGNDVAVHIENALHGFDYEKPWVVVPDLVKAYEVLNKLDNKHWKNIKSNEILNVIKNSMALFLEAKANTFSYTPGDSATISFEAVNRSGIDVELLEVYFNEVRGESIKLNQGLTENTKFSFDHKMVIPNDMAYTNPYWLTSSGSLGMYTVNDQIQIGKPENDPALTASFVMNILGTTIAFESPIIFKRNDPVDGEVYRPLEITPPVFTNILNPVTIFESEEGKNISVKVTAGKDNLKGTLSLSVPAGWNVKPQSIEFDIKSKDGEGIFDFVVTPPKKQSEGYISSMATINGSNYDNELSRLEYDHIPVQGYYPKSSAKVVRIDLRKKGNQIGYIMGAGDDIPKSLRQVGYQVQLLDKDEVNAENLKQYDAVILGVRAFNTVDWLKFKNTELFKYAENGGTVVVQYNTNRRLVTKDIAPYELTISRERVAVEEAEVRVLEEKHPILNAPNKISSKDFDNWVQERGLYFANKWAPEFKPILSSNDPNEEPRNGGLLVAQYGNGYYIYTGYSWFRELPAGVPGAYRLFTNLISIGK